MMSRPGLDPKTWTVLLSGSSGVIGTSLKKRLTDLGVEVLPVFHKAAHGFFQECFNAAGQAKKIGRPNVAFIHLAGISHVQTCKENPRAAVSANVERTIDSLEVCRQVGIQRYIFASSAAIYGTTQKRSMVESDLPRPENFYAATKAAAETLTQSYSSTYGFAARVVRISNMYGPIAHPDTVISTMIQELRTLGEIKPRVTTSVRDYIYMDDLTDGMAALLFQMGTSGYDCINLSTGIGNSVQKVANILSRAKGVANTQDVPDQVPQEKVDSMLVLDNSHIHELTGWRPKYSLEEGLKLTLQNFDYSRTLGNIR